MALAIYIALFPGPHALLAIHIHVPGEPGNEATILCVLYQALHMCTFHVPGSLGTRLQHCVCYTRLSTCVHFTFQESLGTGLQYCVCYRSSTHEGCDHGRGYRGLLLRMFSVEAILILVKHKSILTSAC